MQKVNVVAITTATLEEKSCISSKLCSLNYYLLQNTCKAEHTSSKPVFGIRVELTNKGSLIDTAEISDITSSLERAKYLLDLLSRNTVTPISLLDVIEDYLVIQYDYDCEYSTLKEETA